MKIVVSIANLATSSRVVSTVQCNTRHLQFPSPMHWILPKLMPQLSVNARNVLKIRYAKLALILIPETAQLVMMASILQ